MISETYMDVGSPHLQKQSPQIQINSTQYLFATESGKREHESNEKSIGYQSVQQKIQFNDNMNFNTYQDGQASPQQPYYQHHQIANSRFLQKPNHFNEKELNNLDYLVIEPSSNIDRKQYENEDLQQSNQQLRTSDVENESMKNVKAFQAETPQFCKNNSFISSDTDQFWNKIISSNNECDEEKNQNSFNNERNISEQFGNYSLMAASTFQEDRQTTKEKLDDINFQREQDLSLIVDEKQAVENQNIEKMNDFNIFDNQQRNDAENYQKSQQIESLFQLKGNEENYLQNQMQFEENGFQTTQEKMVVQTQQQLQQQQYQQLLLQQQSQYKEKIEESFLIKIDEFQKQDHHPLQINQKDLLIEKSQIQNAMCNLNDNNINHNQQEEEDANQLKKYKDNHIFTQDQQGGEDHQHEEEDYLFSFQKDNDNPSCVNNNSEIDLPQTTLHQPNYKLQIESAAQSLNKITENSDLNNSQTQFQNNNQNFSQMNSNVDPSFHYQQIDYQNNQPIQKQGNSLIQPLCCQQEMTKTTQSDQQFQQHPNYQWQNNTRESTAIQSDLENRLNCHQFSDKKQCCPIAPFPYDNQLFPNDIKQNSNQMADQSLQQQQHQEIIQSNSQLQQQEQLQLQQQQYQQRQPLLSIKGIPRKNQQPFETNIFTKQNHLLPTEQQINIADYVFLNGKDVLQRIHIRGRTESELQNIIQSTQSKIQNLTLNHNGLHFKSSQNHIYQPSQRQSGYPTNQIFSDKNMRDHSHAPNYQTYQAKSKYCDWDYKKNIKLDDIQKFSQFNNKSHDIDSVNDINPKIRIKLGNELLVQSVISQQAQIEQNQDNIVCLSGLNMNPQDDSRYMQIDQEYGGYSKDSESSRQQNRDISRNNGEGEGEEESFEKSSNLTSEQWHCIQQLQKHKKKNVAKNIMTAFKNFIQNPTKFGYSQQQIESALSYYNKTKKISESFDEMQNKFLKYIVKKKFNHYTIKLLIQHPNYGEVFEYFLKQLSDFWLEQSKVHDIEAHLAMINFLKEAYNDIEIIAQLKKYDKRKY